MREQLTREEKIFVETSKPTAPYRPVYDTWLNNVNKLTADIVKRSVTKLAALEETKNAPNKYT